MSTTPKAQRFVEELEAYLSPEQREAETLLGDDHDLIHKATEAGQDRGEDRS
jgi:hypothetical protein